ncbi:MAG TPA: hypothetical protein DHV18_11725, partial [Brochothrix thermosphacta]|nr:hypothetical protein [Brochothrix thermosphacta]
RRKKLAQNPGFINQCWLMKAGVPFSVIFPGLTALMPHERIAMGVVIGELEGGTYNWSTRRWEESK